MKYNKITTLVVCGAAALATASCSLDYEPISTPSELTQGKQTDSTTAVLKDKAAAEAQLKSLYELLRSRQEHAYLDYLLVGDSHCDNAYAGTTGAEVQPYENNSIDASNSVLSRDWNNYLTDIASANVLINGVEQLKNSGKLTESECNTLRAQGEIFRAFMMFRMARLWGSFPVITTIAKTITSDNIDEVYPTYYPPRKTAEECYQQIVADLTDAEKYAPDLDASDKTIMSKAVAQALLAKVYAEKPLRDYNKVVEYADKVIATNGLSLEPDYATLWAYDEASGDCVKRNTTEGILEAHYDKGNGNWVTWMFGRQLDKWDFYFTWAKWITPSRDIISAFDKEGDEVRKNQSLVYYECTWSNYYPASHYPFMYKMRSAFQNLYWLRLADIILIKAEAEAALGNLSESAKLVNQIRERAKLNDLTAASTSSKESMLTAVLNERRLELAFEGERWYDLCRNDRLESTLNDIDKRDTGRSKLVKKFDANSYLLPIPQTALDQNNNLEQNPGY